MEPLGWETTGLASETVRDICRQMFGPAFRVKGLGFVANGLYCVGARR